MSGNKRNKPMPRPERSKPKKITTKNPPGGPNTPGAKKKKNKKK